jgi:hypothetical protein
MVLTKKRQSKRHATYVIALKLEPSLVISLRAEALVFRRPWSTLEEFCGQG